METLLLLLICIFIGFLCAVVETVMGKGSAWTFFAVCMGISFLVGLKAKAETYYRFTYKNGLVVGSPGVDYFEARTKASKICFQALTGGKYQGEEESLRIIDLCANPAEGK